MKIQLSQAGAGVWGLGKAAGKTLLFVSGYQLLPLKFYWGVVLLPLLHFFALSWNMMWDLRGEGIWMQI